MSENVISMNGNVPRGSVNHDLVQYLDDLKQSAMRGELRGIGCFELYNNRSVSTGVEFSGDDIFEAISGAAILNRRVMDWALDPAD